MNARATLLAPLAALLPSTALAGDLWIVNQTGAGDFPWISLAVEAAADGDSIVVVGDYHVNDAVVIDGKGVSIVHDEVGQELLILSIQVSNLPAGSEVLLSNLRVDTHELRSTFTNCAGRVVVDGLRPDGGVWLFDCEVNHCDDVVLVDCRFEGWDGYWDGCNEDVDGTPALIVRGDSRVSVYGGRIRGGYGGYDFCDFWYGWDAPGIVIEDTSSVYCAGTVLIGAPPAYVVDQGVFTEYTGPPSFFIGPWLEPEGSTSTLRVQGPPGHRALLMVGTETTHQPLSALQGVLHVRRTPPIPMGAIPASGLLSFPFVQPQLPPGIEAALLHAQVVLSPPPMKMGGAISPVRFALTNPKTWVVRD